MTSILHITADYPDVFSANKTQAVANLLDGTNRFFHKIYSINRINGVSGVRLVGKSETVATLTYSAPPYGLLLETFLIQVADWIIQDCRTLNQTFDLVHAHKLTIEGFIARRVARALACPYICTVRGNTDQKYLKFLPMKRLAFRDVARDAATLLPVTPWVARYIEQKLSLGRGGFPLLPTISSCSKLSPPTQGNGRFVTVFHLDHWRLKGMPNLFSALAQLNSANLEVSLDIYGDGSPKSKVSLGKEIDNKGLRGRVNLVGPISREEIPKKLNMYHAFVLPTLRETFGMVYIEALFSGIPVLYSKDRGIDGYFDGKDIGVRCDPKSVSSITGCLSDLYLGAARMKEAILKMQSNGELLTFRKSTVCNNYTEIVNRLLYPSA